MKTKSIRSNEFFDILYSEGVVCLFYEFEDAVIKAVANGDNADYYVKLRGRTEFKANNKNNLVTEALLSPVLIFKEDYDKF